MQHAFHIGQAVIADGRTATYAGAHAGVHYVYTVASGVPVPAAHVTDLDLGAPRQLQLGALCVARSTSHASRPAHSASSPCADLPPSIACPFMDLVNELATVDVSDPLVDTLSDVSFTSRGRGSMAALYAHVRTRPYGGGPRDACRRRTPAQRTRAYRSADASASPGRAHDRRRHEAK